MWQEALQLSGGGGTPFQFSTKEQKTNLKWLNGKPIYQITFDMGGFTTKTLSSIGISNIYEIVGSDGIWDGESNGNSYYANSFCTGANEYWNFYIQDKNTITTRGNLNQTCKHLYITLYYTKTTD